MQARLEKFANRMTGISVPDTEAARLLKKGSNRFICTINKQETIHCALLKWKEGGFYIYISAATIKKLQVSIGTKLEVSFKADETKYQSIMPEELEAVLSTDPEAASVFEGLTGGNQRGLIYLVVQVKSTDKRIERALKIAAKLKSGIVSPRKIMQAGG
ncbi:MAG TPA: YdeI/OmpD-associated family protein [Flavisolibacter sp.]|nr:YdeI/OmpD-associated family protein [Flavisolibacter sp.]